MSDRSPEVTKSQDAVQATAPPGSAGSIPTLNVEPLHHPEEMAHVEVPHNVENIPHGTTVMNGKALLAKKMAATGTSFYSPSDALVSPCTQKLSSQKGKRWANSKVKPIVFGKSNLNTTSNSFLDPHDPVSTETNSTEPAKDGESHND
ncbi:uncharacterized protein PGTG_11682 [Puccinia graminis f. sp. tritici CRL 75-36-700-3]|uniref:Uncharacterized protein n=1 Tax=Puccinia graminis f. sp. tritici (strain CRL 75-36-700-3 / race SCCL) TaxID=418459 RepID=E3KNQ1_PUCGT|nr:uncharacterized protein PGTG_11682 [Puccinia graminis f. sp. tritici CRL 75-36-700-3]EFP85926.1 hypothetical protein PGTG_11682 [Puccinia graminis f. sp. tritici CRL 75-36-700-3]